jgi:ribosomal subunit interface protein
MQLPLQITFRGMAHSPEIETAIREKAAKLEHHFDRIMSCRVVVEQPAQHKRHGKPFTVHLDIKVPGGEIAITHDHDEDLHVALHQAFDAARRKLEDHVRVQRGDVKAHRPAPTED